MDELQQIQAQIEELQKKAQEIAQAKRQPIIDRIKEEIKNYGITAKELGLKGSKTKDKAPVEPKYRQGENTWSGRGRTPIWLVEFENNGGKRADIEIK